MPRTSSSTAMRYSAVNGSPNASIHTSFLALISSVDVPYCRVLDGEVGERAVDRELPWCGADEQVWRCDDFVARDHCSWRQGHRDQLGCIYTIVGQLRSENVSVSRYPFTDVTVGELAASAGWTCDSNRTAPGDSTVCY